uniref:ATP-dependent DNA helicase n=2 Tax=Globodera rostochiensis TaxID=31243 RepID=A0A914IA57_GLORO
MPSKKQELRKQRIERYQRRTDQSVSPGSSQIPDSPLDCNGIAGGNEASQGTTPKMSALRISTPAPSMGKKRGRPPKAGNKGVSLTDTPNSTVAESATSSPCLKKEKAFEYDRKVIAEVVPSTPVSTKEKRGRPAKKKRGPGRGKTVDSESECSIMDESIVGSETMQVEEPLEEVDANLKLEKVGCTSGDVPEHIDFNVVQINFAVTRNFNCRIWRWAAIGLYQDDATSSGPRFIETCWNNPKEWLNDGFIAMYLAYLASISQRKVVVLDSIVFDAAVSRVRGSYRNYTFGFDASTPAEVILMPINFPGHWTILIHDVETGTFFADSLQMSILDLQKSNLIKGIIAEISSTTFESISIDYVDNVNLTPQNDGFSCGYFVCLYAESWLMSPKTFILKNLNLNFEKKRILWHLNELYSSDNVSYHPREGVASPCPFLNRLEMEDVQSTSKIVQSNVQLDDDSDDIMIVDVPPKEKKVEESIFFIDPSLHEQAEHPASAAMNAVLTQAELPGENQADELALIVESCQVQEPIAQANEVIFKRPKTPPRRSSRIKRLSNSLSRSPSPAVKRAAPTKGLKSTTPLTKRCHMVHKGWHCAAAAAKHFPDYSDSGKLGEKKCPHCGAHLFQHEDSNICCRQGRVELPTLNPHPGELKQLIVGDNQTREGKEFVRNMSRYNNLLQFASVSAGNKPCPSGGPMAVILNGEFHRRISSMQAGTTQTPGFGQLYILDPVEAMEQRRNNPTFTGEKITTNDEFVQGHKLNEKTLESLEKMIQENHPAAKAYKQAREQLQDLFKTQKPEELRFFRMTLLDARRAPTAVKDPKLHPNQIITPSTGEGMFAIHADPSGAPPPKGIWVENKQGQLNEIAPFSPWTDSLAYPLIKPMGDDGYTTGIKYAKPASRKRKSDVITDHLFDSDADSDLESCAADSDASSDAGSVASGASSVCGRFGKARQFVSLRDYCKYYLAIRDNDVAAGYHHILTCGGGLGQRWILDQAAKIDWQIATFLRRPDMDLRISTPRSLLLYLINQYNKQKARQNPNAQRKSVDDIGSVVRLSEKNVNSLQYWKKMYEDCNTIFARYHDAKKARLFITFTNNREWPEFKQNLYKNGQVFTDRFDLWMRVWCSKIAVFRQELYEKSYFGTIIGSGESMEFQGRGGPHAHIVAQTDLDAIPEVIQEYIWAHIPSLPDKDDDTPIAQMHREIRELIHMQLHRCSDTWCGPKDPKTGRCKKGFPATYSKCTILHPDRPAVYFRPSPAEGGAQIEVNNLIYDNSHVVPFNPFVLIRFRVHHNVLFAYGNKANIKYALKYPFKGPGHCYVECKEESGNKIGIDEPAQYAKMNFRGATEAYAVVNSIAYVRLSHHVVKLSIHLPNQQPIVFRAGQLVSKAQQIEQGDLPETPCSAYWKQWQNEWKDEPEFKDMLFVQVPERFRWVNDKWVAYKRKPSKRPPIGRIVPVPPSDPERFALYQLMRHYPGDPDHLKMANQQPCTSFIEAAIKHGLLEDDRVWDKTLEEASLSRWPDQMRWLFVSILVFGQPSNARELWDKYKEHMYHPHGIASKAQRLAKELQALADIDWRLFNFGFSCVHFGLPDPPNSIAKNTEKAVEEFFFGDDDLNVPPGLPNANQPQQSQTPPLNSDQQMVFDAVVKAIQTDPSDQSVPRRLFVYGDGGTGKTYLFGQIIRRLRKAPYSNKVLATASTGCAAILLPYGKTAHSTFRLGREVSLDKLPSIPLESFFARRIREAQLIIIDEITMLNNTVIEVIDRVCKEMAIRQHKELLFGGKTVIFSGDFKQSLPVVPHEGLAAQVAACFQTSPLFGQFTTMKLTINHRLGKGQQDYMKMCRQIGHGETGEFFWIPPQFLVQSSEDLIDFVYPDFQKLLGNDKELLNRLILAPHIQTCDEINELMMDNVPGQVRDYLSTDKPLDERPLDIDEIESEVAALNQRTDSGMPPHRLRLKVGCVVVLLINKSDREGLINGTRIVIEELGEEKITGRAINGTAVGGQVRFFIERTRNVYEDKAPGGLKYERLQFPIKPAFAMTILKGQGQTIRTVGIDLEREVFSHGQLYTAFSRWTATMSECMRQTGRLMHKAEPECSTLWQQICFNCRKGRQNEGVSEAQQQNMDALKRNEVQVFVAVDKFADLEEQKQSNANNRRMTNWRTNCSTMREIVCRADCQPPNSTDYMRMKIAQIQCVTQPKKMVKQMECAVVKFKPVNAHQEHQALVKPDAKRELGKDGLNIVIPQSNTLSPRELLGWTAPVPPKDVTAIDMKQYKEELKDMKQYKEELKDMKQYKEELKDMKQYKEELKDMKNCRRN